MELQFDVLVEELRSAIKKASEIGSANKESEIIASIKDNFSVSKGDISEITKLLSGKTKQSKDDAQKLKEISKKIRGFAHLCDVQYVEDDKGNINLDKLKTAINNKVAKSKKADKPKAVAVAKTATKK